ncbi:MAG: hypothetical protein ACTHW2_04195 [Tissierella sp.]|uniref:hypothetical protein n=1 Tax=Tissierella sp. TaxID=41274 RepID=UPI003F9C80B5
MKKLLIMILISSFIVTACTTNKDTEKDYISDAREITWSEVSKGDVKGMENITFTGKVMEINENTGTLTVDQDEGSIFYVKDIEKYNIEVDDEITIWGIYMGYNKGFPMVDSKIIEKKRM